MDTKIFLQGFNSKKSVNTSEGLNVSLKGKRRLLPTNDITEVISQFDQYNEEREACNTIRLTCQVNPICSNVLFNRVSEIVKDEGSSALTYINYGILQGTTADGNVDYGEDEERIRYKDRKMSFWRGNSIGYQTYDTAIASQPYSETLPHVVTAYTAHSVTQTINTPIEHPTNSIRDMQLSNCGYVYHCGLDILNNHLIRSNTFKCVCKMPQNYPPTGYTDNYSAFNTIADLMRDVHGNKVVEKLIFPKEAGVPNNFRFIAMHLYRYDDILSFEECIEQRLLDAFNGWVGFYNRPKIKTYQNFSVNHTELNIERPIMYMNGGDMVDMYPSRDLYSFVPRYNRYRNRIEKNWNYCLTYPSSSTTEGFDDIIEVSNNSMRAIYFDENITADNGTRYLVIYSIAKHGLMVGDMVNVYINTVDETGNTVNTRVIDNAEVTEVVNEYIFTVFNANTQISREWVEITREEFRNGSFESNGRQYTISEDRKTCYLENDGNPIYYYIINDRYVNLDDEAQNLSYKKVVNDIECEYYVRIFSKIPNFKNASADTSNEYQIYANDGELIHIYQGHEYDFESHVSRLAFARNIYSDEVGELVFTDDINIENLHDNLGRPLTSIYLTLIKNNRGYKEWYGYDCDSGFNWQPTEITGDTVEYSHCFGQIMCGIETSEESTCNNNIASIYKLSMIGNEHTNRFGYNVDAINETRLYHNRNYIINAQEVWFDTDRHYYGDLCYYDNYNAIERSIQPIMHRFNTAQRESQISMSNRYYSGYIYDEILSDDYDASGHFIITANTVTGANRCTEGYYYNPHYEIPIKTFDKIQTMFPDFLTIRSFVNNNDGTYRITTLENHYLTRGDKSIIYDRVNRVYYYCTTVSSPRDTYKTFTCMICDEDGNEVSDLSDMFSSSEELRNYKLFKMDNLNIPPYARVLRDGSCRLIWRNVLNNGFNMSDDTVEVYPFTNGAFYINRSVDLFVRRQDPFDIYGLYSNDIEGLGMEDENDVYIRDNEIEC